MATNSKIYWKPKARALNDCSESAFPNFDKVDITLVKGRGSMQKIGKNSFGRVVVGEVHAQGFTRRRAFGPRSAAVK